jgi:hypothetical protein
MSWLEILGRRVEEKGNRIAARELGVSPSTVSLVMAGKYGASTSNIEARVMAIYGRGGKVECPELGEIDAAECAETHERARKFGRRATGNPETLRLYLGCLKCPARRVTSHRSQVTGKKLAHGS